LLVAGADRDNALNDPTSQRPLVNRPLPTAAETDANAQESFLQKHPRLRRELYILGGGLAAGLIMMPVCVYIAGTLSLGPYYSGGWVAFFVDLFKGLFRGWWAAWVLVLGPYALVAFLRVTRLAYRRFLKPAESD
jgi:hypothetical protein